MVLVGGSAESCLLSKLALELYIKFGKREVEGSYAKWLGEFG